MNSEGASGPDASGDRPDGQPALWVYFDADVLFAGATSPSEHSASQVLLTLSEITLVEGRISELAVTECRRNLAAKLPSATGDFERLVGRALSVVDAPNRETLLPHVDRADWADLPHLVSALEQDCSYLATYNVGGYEPGHPQVDVLRPGALVRRVREQLSAP
jgi:hypothetical protein